MQSRGGSGRMAVGSGRFGGGWLLRRRPSFVTSMTASAPLSLYSCETGDNTMGVRP